jgi:hypothetical protein
VGQLEGLPRGVTCQTELGAIRESQVRPLVGAIGDREVAASVVLERLVLQQEVELDARAVLAAELAFVQDHFGGSVNAYLGALRRIQLSRVAARGLLLDELRRDAVRARFVPAAPSARAIREFHETYADLQVRLVEVARPVAWLGGKARGLAVETFAPQRIFTLERPARVRTLHGLIHVKPLEDTVALGSVPAAQARPAIVAALTRFARVHAYETWLAKAQERALEEALCAGDRLPSPAALTLDDLLPFVRPETA